MGITYMTSSNVKNNFYVVAAMIRTPIMHLFMCLARESVVTFWDASWYLIMMQIDATTRGIFYVVETYSFRNSTFCYWSMMADGTAISAVQSVDPFLSPPPLCAMQLLSGVDWPMDFTAIQNSIECDPTSACNAVKSVGHNSQHTSFWTALY